MRRAASTRHRWSRRRAARTRKGLVLVVTAIRWFALCLPFILAASGTHRALGGTAPSRLTIASEGARPPYNFLDGDRLEGFEIELGHDLCRRMAVRCTFVAQDWDSLIPGLLAHRYDAIMAALEITPQRQAQIAFSTPYVRLPSAFLVTKSTKLAGASLQAFAGHAIGVESGGTHQAYMEKVYGAARLHLYRSLSDAILDLEAGRVEGVIGDKDAIMTFLATRRDAACCKLLADVPRDPAYFGDGIGVGLRKDDAELKAAFDRALADCKADGTLASIAARYFSFPID